MSQGQYWVRRHLDDQRRAAGGANRQAAAKAADDARRAKASQRDAAAEKREQTQYGRQYAIVQRKLDLTRHFQKVQSEVRRALAKLEGGHKNQVFELSFEGDDDTRNLLTDAVTTYQAHSDFLNSNDEISAAMLAKHIQNSKKMLIAFGRARKLKTRWFAKDRRFEFGGLTLDFSEPEPSSIDDWRQAQQAKELKKVTAVEKPKPSPRKISRAAPPPPLAGYQTITNRPRYEPPSNNWVLVIICFCILVVIGQLLAQI